ncbi:hypothetical protein [Bacteroides sp.]|uniref:hypothetical protein n=1 Tax=Bacteroides sp. TaxID=29523 RepID=UPI002633DACF|nr:hypothetical protein [Bacteroides sp.]MDD3037458.1 hypothetical protein [Bacteroides sp.]
MEEKELWMSKLKEKLADYSEPTPTSGWEQLEKELISPVEKKIYPYRRWIMAAAAVILLAVVSSVSLYFLGTPTADEIRHIQTPTLASLPDALPGVNQPNIKGAMIDPVLRPITKDHLAKTETNKREPKTNIAKQGTGDKRFAKAENSELPAVVSKNDLKDETTKQPEEVNDTQEKQTNTIQEKQTNKNKPRRPSGKDKLHIPIGNTSVKKGTWSMGLSVGNAGGASAEIGSGASHYMSRVSMLSVSNGLLAIPNDQTLVFEQGVPYLRKANDIVDIKHHQPISFGLSVRKSLSKGFSLETGLTYTLLSSDAKLGDSERNIEQKLHYLGIPLRANWNFLEKRFFTLYVTGGGMVEKCVYGKLGSEKETVNPLQFSVSGGVGVQVNATKRVGIYVEPGVSYFFDDGSNIQTIRKENPFNFNMQAGIRLTY